MSAPGGGGVSAPRGVPGRGGVSAPGGCLVGCPPPPTATAAGGTHPTGMHSCSLSTCSCKLSVN